MSTNPLQQFRHLAGQQRQPRQGRVVAVAADFITVSIVGFTNRRLRRQTGDGTAYKRGDNVYINEQNVLGRVRAAPEVYVL